jgi:hypothetical protein
VTFDGSDRSRAGRKKGTGMNHPRDRHGRLRLRLAGAVLLALAGLALVACSTGNGDSTPAPPDAAPAMTAASVEGPVLVTGTVSRDGGPLRDTPVAVQIWSNEDVEVGESIDLHEIGPVLTDEHGRYTIVLARQDLAAEYLEGEDVVNFDVRVMDPFLTPTSTSAEHTADGSWTDVGGGTGPMTVDFDLGTMKATVTYADGSKDRWSLVRLG